MGLASAAAAESLRTFRMDGRAAVPTLAFLLGMAEGMPDSNPRGLSAVGWNQAMENCGGARPECAWLTVVAKRSGRRSDSRVAEAGVTWALADRLRCAHWGTGRGRQQSCWQHPGGAWNSALWEARSCIGFRMQQACGGVAEIARATGANTPTSSRTSNNLAVRRCMGFKSYLDGLTRNRFQREAPFFFASADNRTNSLQV